MTMRGGGCLALRFVRAGAALGVAAVGVVVMGGPGGRWGLVRGADGDSSSSKISAFAMGKQRSVIRRSVLMLALT